MMRFIFSVILTISLPLFSSCKKSSSSSSPAPGAATPALTAEVELVESIGLLGNDFDSPMSVKGVLHIQNANENTQVEISSDSDDCAVYLQEQEPYNNSAWNIVVVQSPSFSGDSTSCERTITITGDNGVTISKVLHFDLTGQETSTVTDGTETGEGEEPTSGNPPVTPEPPGSGTCMGSATPCNLRIGMGSCMADGCYWSTMTSSCSGYVTPCYVANTKTMCQAIMGCIWQ